MDRLKNVANHIAPCPSSSCSKPGCNEVVICGGVRSALCKAKKGSFKDTPCEEMLKGVLQGLIKQTKVNPEAVQDICIGNVLQVGSGALTSRMGQLLAGFSSKTPLYVVNRQCSSGLQACMNIVSAIESGYIDIGIGGGVESMSQNDMQSSLNPDNLSEEIFACNEARNCLLPMGMTSENVASKYGVSRKKQDEFAVLSHQKAAAARKKKIFDQEIIPIKVNIKNEKTGEMTQKVVAEDEGIREGTTLQDLEKLKPAFQKDGTTTAGNSSQVTDGAAVVLFARRSVAEKMGLPILARVRGYNVSGCPPEIMGIGPAIAIPAVLKSTGLDVSAIDIFEINEAFASQAVYCVETLGIPLSKVNPNGGAIALGHPLGCTGARQIVSMLNQLKYGKKKLGVVSMCIGTGMGAAAVIENLQ